MTIFTPDETATLEALYPNRDEWFLYLYLLSDRVQEENERHADGMRFIYAVNTRPYRYSALQNKQSPRYWWCGTSASVAKELKEYEERMVRELYNNYIPLQMQIDTSVQFSNVTELIVLFLERWAALTPDTRTHLWSEWVTETANV